MTIDTTKMSILCTEGHYNLYLDPETKDYIIYFEAANQHPYEISRAKVLCKRMTKWFTANQIRKAKATIHAMNYVNSRFK